MTAYEQTLAALRVHPKTWLVTGAAGFIGTSLIEALLAANQTVVGFDNLTTGKRENVKLLTALGGSRFTMREETSETWTPAETPAGEWMRSCTRRRKSRFQLPWRPPSPRTTSIRRGS